MFGEEHPCVELLELVRRYKCLKNINYAGPGNRRQFYSDAQIVLFYYIDGTKRIPRKNVACGEGH